MRSMEPLVAELKHEAATTRRLLERVPPDRLAWQPHAKSMTLGRLAAHIANLPGMLIGALTEDKLDANDLKARSPSAESVANMLEAFDQQIERSLELLKAERDEQYLLAPWRYTSGEHVIFEMPRIAVIRFVALNHIIHHRGQLSVYLRLLDIPLPSVYGPSADEQMP